MCICSGTNSMAVSSILWHERGAHRPVISGSKVGVINFKVFELVKKSSGFSSRYMRILLANEGPRLFKSLPAETSHALIHQRAACTNRKAHSPVFYRRKHTSVDSVTPCKRHTERPDDLAFIRKPLVFSGSRTTM